MSKPSEVDRPTAQGKAKPGGQSKMWGMEGGMNPKDCKPVHPGPDMKVPSTHTDGLGKMDSGNVKKFVRPSPEQKAKPGAM